MQEISCPIRFFCPAANTSIDALPRLCPVGSICPLAGRAAPFPCPVGYVRGIIACEDQLHFVDAMLSTKRSLKNGFGPLCVRARARVCVCVCVCVCVYGYSF